MNIIELKHKIIGVIKKHGNNFNSLLITPFVSWKSQMIITNLHYYNNTLFYFIKDNNEYLELTDLLSYNDLERLWFHLDPIECLKFNQSKEEK